MNKHRWQQVVLFLSAILLISIALFLGKYRTHKEQFSSLCVSDEEFNTIISTRIQSDNVILDKLIFDNNKLFFDDVNNHFYYSLVNNSDTAYDPYVEWEGSSRHLVIKNTTISDESIHKNETIELLIYDDSTYQLASLSCTKLPLINITTKQKKDKQEIKLCVFDNVNNVNNVYKGSMHVRGGMTLAYPKQGYKININNNEREKILDLKQTGEYILYAGYNDQEKIRNVFSTQLWYEGCAKNNSFNIENGIFYKYVELFINNQYWGLYAIANGISDSIFDINSININENIYKKAEWDIEKDIYTDVNKLSTIYELKAKNEKDIAYNNLRDYFSQIYDSNVSKNELLELVDIDNNIDFTLFFPLIMGYDNLTSDGERMKNFYLISKDDHSKIKYLYLPWDMDLTWGNVFYESQPNSTYPYCMVSDNDIFLYKYSVTSLLVNDGEIKEKILKRYSYLRNNEWSNDNINRIIDSYEKDIFCSGAYERDKGRWPDGSYIKGEGGLSTFREFVLNRFTHYDAYITSSVK